MYLFRCHTEIQYFIRSITFKGQGAEAHFSLPVLRVCCYSARLCSGCTKVKQGHMSISVYIPHHPITSVPFLLSWTCFRAFQGVLIKVFNLFQTGPIADHWHWKLWKREKQLCLAKLGRLTLHLGYTACFIGPNQIWPACKDRAEVPTAQQHKWP